MATFVVRPGRWSRTMLAASVIVLAATFAGCQAGSAQDSSEAFCSLALTSSESRSETEVNQYYADLEQVAPDELAAEVRTLGDGWQRMSMPLNALTQGDASNIERPQEVSDAARAVMAYVHDQCGSQTATGVYLILPEQGL